MTMEGLASGWAEHARPGDVIGAAGGGGVTAARADWYLVVGDETALPAIGRMLEHMHADATGVAIPGGAVTKFAWVSAESKTALAMRKWLRSEAGIDRRSTLVIGYRRRGMSETGYGTAADHDRVGDEHEHEHAQTHRDNTATVS